MPRERVLLEVSIDLDSIPGPFHTPESAQSYIQAILNKTVPHYDPIVIIAKNE